MSAVTALLLTSCSAPSLNEAPAEAEPVAAAQNALTTNQSMELIGPTTCSQQLNKLKNCVIPSTTFTATVTPTAVPHRTEIVRTRVGNCSTSFPLQVSLTPSAGSPTTFSYLSDERILLKDATGGQISSLVIADSSPWTPSLAVDKTCRVSLAIAVNAIDIDTAQQAQSWINGLQAQLDAKTAERDRYRDLVTFSAAYDFMHSLAQMFYTEVTNDGMQHLRAAAIAARPGLRLAFDSCSNLPSDDGDKLFELYDALVVAGDPSNWRRPDGTTKTLADFMDADASAIYETITRLEAQASPNYSDANARAFQDAAGEVEALQSKLTLAKAELASWLTPTP